MLRAIINPVLGLFDLSRALSTQS